LVENLNSTQTQPKHDTVLTIGAFDRFINNPPPMLAGINFAEVEDGTASPHQAALVKAADNMLRTTWDVYASVCTKMGADRRVILNTWGAMLCTIAAAASSALILGGPALDDDDK